MRIGIIGTGTIHRQRIKDPQQAQAFLRQLIGGSLLAARWKHRAFWTG